MRTARSIKKHDEIRPKISGEESLAQRGSLGYQYLQHSVIVRSFKPRTEVVQYFGELLSPTYMHVLPILQVFISGMMVMFFFVIIVIFNYDYFKLNYMYAHILYFN